MTYAWPERFRAAVFLTVFAVLPLVGLVSGPSYAPLLFGLAAVLTLSRPAWPRIDLNLAGLALLFLALCAVGLTHSILLPVSGQRLGQMAAIWLGCLLLLALPPPDLGVSERLFPLMFGAIAAGALLLSADTLFDYRLQRLLTGGAVNAAYKYNRGLISLILIAWPIMSALSNNRAVVLACLVALSLMVGLSSTGLLAFLISVLVWVLAHHLPRLARWLVGIAVTLPALSLPWLLRPLSGARHELAPYIKSSGLHRLEIWDYMSSRILERPLTGWGLGASKAVPIHPEELASYIYVSPDGVYPHNQWIETWVETGLPGVLVALALVWLVLWRLRSPFALAALVAALVASALNFEITTDSWWAALAASALLFRLSNQFSTRNI